MRITSCRRDEHGYGISAAIGDGLLRRTCGRCGDVELDMRTAPQAFGGLFEAAPSTSWFAQGWNATHGGLNFATGA